MKVFPLAVTDVSALAQPVLKALVIQDDSFHPHRAAHQQLLLFLNSPFSVIWSLVGLVGEMPFLLCML